MLMVFSDGIDVVGVHSGNVPGAVGLLHLVVLLCVVQFSCYWDWVPVLLL